jgi:hypothetical protein
MSIDSFENLARRIHEQLKGREKSPPTVDTLRELIETLFFASLRTEESEPIRCRIAFINRDDPDPNRPARIVADRWQPVPFKSEIPFSVSNLVKLAKAVDPWAATLAVWTNNGALNIWGAVDQSVHYNAFVFRENNEGPEMPGMFQAVIEGTGEIAVYKRFVLLGALKKQTLVEKQLAVFSRGLSETVWLRRSTNLLISFMMMLASKSFRSASTGATHSEVNGFRLFAGY